MAACSSGAELRGAGRDPSPTVSADQATELAFAVIEGRHDDPAQAEAALLSARADGATDRTTTRTLARLLNLRLTEGDYSKAELQARLYDELLGDVGDPDALSQEQFSFYCFREMARAAAFAAEERDLKAFASVRDLERTLRRRRAAYPDEIETHAMAGNYALNLSAIIPVGKRHRLRDAIEALEVQQARWDEQDVLSQGLGVAPGTRAVFSLWLAELQISAGHPERAAPHFRRVVDAASLDAATPSVAALASRAGERLTQLEQGAAPPYPLPPWPRGRTSCVACHSQTHTLAGLD